jgi:hypothetical protein
MVTLFYDMIGADNHGEHRHPQLVWKEIGLRPLEVEAYTISDCWRLVCTRENVDEVTLPKFIEEAVSK